MNTILLIAGTFFLFGCQILKFEYGIGGHCNPPIQSSVLNILLRMFWKMTAHLTGIIVLLALLTLLSFLFTCPMYQSSSYLVPTQIGYNDLNAILISKS